MNLKEYCKEIESFLKEYLKESHADGYVLGLSGGVDSTLVAAIAKSAVGKDKLFCYNFPIDSNKADQNDATEIAKELDLNFKVVDLSNTYHLFKEELGEEIDTATSSNLKVRMRMTAIYAFGQKKHCLVLGTDNLDESYVGYFTKYGDGGVDLLPIVRLTKGEVKQACDLYNISKKFSNRIPSAGLFEGQTDEGEMGIKYTVLDDYLLGKSIDENSQKRIEYLHKISEHKRVEIPRPKEFKRD